MRDMKDSGIEWIGKMPASWSTNYIKNLFYTVAGSTPKSERTEYWDGEILWITPADYKTEDMYISAGKRNLTAEGYKSCSTTLVPKNSIIFSKRAPIGTVAINTNELCTNQGCIACVKKEESSEEYYYYVMSVATEHFELLGSGTTFKEISANSFANVKLPFPSEEEQRKIAHYLNNQCKAINALKEDIQSQISSLEEYKRSVITEAVTKGLNADVEMKDSGQVWLGKIPSHWMIKPFKYVLMERSHKNNPILTEERLSLSIDKGVTLYAEKTTNLDRFKDDVSQYKLAHKGDLVLNSMNMIVGAVGISNYFGCVSPAYYTYYDNEEEHITARYCEYVFRTPIMRKVLFSLGKGIMAIDRGDGRVNTCRLKVSRDDLRMLHFPVPPISEQRSIVKRLDEICKEVDAIIEEKKQQLATLEQYKKSLIYEYVTGKKEVPNE